ncbi:MAG: D-glycerate dehydrogenase [Planctomycetes bacterium]|nr:D-glycerate dehydrogenase [Planctomycetota bacterium]
MPAERPRVFVAREIPAAGLDRILATCDADVWREDLPPPRDELLARAAGCQGILSLLTETIDAELMDAAGDALRVVSNYAVGFNNIDIQEATRRGIRVGNTPGVLTDATADMAVTLLLAVGRRLVEANRFVMGGQWQTWQPLGHIGVDLVDKTAGIVGLGRIGSTVARRLRGGWNMRILYFDQYRNEAAEQELGAEQVEFEALLDQADFVSVHLNLDDSTSGLFDAAAFRRMKNTAVFVNTARGPLHVQRDLAEALRRGEIFAAGLDVTDPEPLPPGDPLLELPNCIVVPHIASATVQSRNGMAEIAADNLLAGLRGEPLCCWVNPEVEQSTA